MIGDYFQEWMTIARTVVKILMIFVSTEQKIVMVENLQKLISMQKILYLRQNDRRLLVELLKEVNDTFKGNDVVKSGDRDIIYEGIVQKQMWWRLRWIVKLKSLWIVAANSLTFHSNCNKYSFCCKKHALRLNISVHKNYSICDVEQSTSARQIHIGIVLCSTNVIYNPFCHFFCKFRRDVRNLEGTRTYFCI